MIRSALLQLMDHLELRPNDIDARAEAVQPGHGEAALNLGRLMVQAHDLDGARSLLEKALVAQPRAAYELDAANPSIAFLYAQLLFVSQRLGPARSILLGLIDRPFAEQAEARALLVRLAEERE